MTDQKTDLLPCPHCGGALTYSQEPHDNGYVAGMYYVYHVGGDKGCRFSPSGHFGDLEEMIEKCNARADLAPMVKPLEWKREKADRATWYADIYTIKWLCEGQYVVLGWAFGENPYGSLKQAKVAAQADYERRILSALTHAPTTPAQAAKLLLSNMQAVDAACMKLGNADNVRVFQVLKAIAEEG